MLVGEREWEKECKNVEVMYVYEKDEREELKREFGSIVCEGENEGIEFVDRSSKSKEEVVEILRERGMCEEEEILMEDIERGGKRLLSGGATLALWARQSLGAPHRMTRTPPSMTRSV